MNVRDLYKRVKKINKDLLAAQAVEINRPLIIKLNQDQLQKSTLSTGAKIYPLYSEAYANRKGFKNPDLKLTGVFYGEMDVDVQENSMQYFVISYTSYTKYLIDRYGPAIFNLSKESIEKAKPSTSKIFIQLWKKAAGLK